MRSNLIRTSSSHDLPSDLTQTDQNTGNRFSTPNNSNSTQQMRSNVVRTSSSHDLPSDLTQTSSSTIPPSSYPSWVIDAEKQLPLFYDVRGSFDEFKQSDYNIERINTVLDDSIRKKCLPITFTNLYVLKKYGKKLEAGGLNKDDQLNFLEGRDRMGCEFLDRLNTLSPILSKDEINNLCYATYEIGFPTHKNVKPFLDTLQANARLLKKIPEATIFCIGESEKHVENLSAFCKLLNNPIIDWFLEKNPQALNSIALAEKAASHWSTLGIYSGLILHKANKDHIHPDSIVSAFQSKTLTRLKQLVGDLQQRHLRFLELGG